MRFTPAACTTAVVLSALAVLLAPTTAHAATAEHAAIPGDTVTLSVRDALAALPVQAENRTGYERTKFKHWTDADRDGCNTRIMPGGLHSEIHRKARRSGDWETTPPKSRPPCRLPAVPSLKAYYSSSGSLSGLVRHVAGKTID